MKYSRKQISKAGEKLVTSKSENDVEEALNLINNWRTNHLHPLVVLKNSLLRLLTKNRIEPNLVSQRLKRLTSIEYKLDLNPSMRLGGMQDIGGYRAVLKDVKDLRKLNDALSSQKMAHKLEKVMDYVKNPKNTGYRSIHFIYTYSSTKDIYDGLKLELQIRTKLQHNWATAVETAGIITKTSLKSNQGPDEWLDFFKIVSSLFALKEKLPLMDDHSEFTMEELMIKCYNYCEELNILTKLKAIRVSTNKIESDNFPGDYYLLNINIIEMFVNIQIFNKNQFEYATNEYLKLEKTINENENAVVLVSANSIKTLKKAYPSYFLDTSEFIQAIEKMNSNCKERKYV
ncbi:RelA/SpoT domain-containing protein [uncultured Flavobacterium sp.]|uniref:RelA/SpoT domain-containing protein n=1 Tax=uncultured Flavobacterium sp. TaxID=165435 RepID=UPI0030EBABDD|tara:strand:- start:60078 stop:61112 length:1035 start_codon:yes stop_codon:yes gene_type:complete